MDAVVVRILFGQLLPQLEDFVGLAGLPQIVRTLLHPVLHGLHVVRLLLVDRLQHVEQFEQLIVPRKGMDVETMERWLAPNLNYEPAGGQEAR